MCFMNDFVETEIKNMKEFLNKISVSLHVHDLRTSSLVCNTCSKMSLYFTLHIY